MIRQKRGYVVISDGQIMHASKEGGPETLWFGKHGTIFNTYDEARQIIKRTKTYRNSQNYQWPWIDTAQIIPVEA